jgi:hypothetical protein
VGASGSGKSTMTADSAERPARDEALPDSELALVAVGTLVVVPETGAVPRFAREGKPGSSTTAARGSA